MRVRALQLDALHLMLTGLPATEWAMAMEAAAVKPSPMLSPGEGTFARRYRVLRPHIMKVLTLQGLMAKPFLASLASIHAICCGLVIV